MFWRASKCLRSLSHPARAIVGALWTDIPVRFSLGTFLIGFAILAMVMRFIAAEARSYRLEQDAIRSLSCHRRCDYGSSSGLHYLAIAIRLADSPPPRIHGTAKIQWVGPDWLSSARRDDAFTFFMRVTAVDLCALHVDDEVIAHLSHLAFLRKLDVTCRTITPERIDRLARLQGLEDLVVNGQRVDLP